MKIWSVVSLTLVVIAVTARADNILSNIYDSAKVGACLLSISPKLTSDCIQAYDQELEGRPRDESNKKSHCCATLRLQSCVEKLSEKECGEEAEGVAKRFMGSVNRAFTSDECVDYGFLTCITITQMAIAGAIVLALLALLSCICCCCCRR